MGQQLQPVSRFSELQLPATLLQAIDDLGFANCTPIQGQILPHTRQGKDALGQAQTGTGKTAAFLITLIAGIMSRQKSAQRPPGTPYAVVIAPVRELAVQIGKDAVDLCRHSTVNSVTVIGGENPEHQLKQLKSRPAELVIGTPGRLLAFCKQGDLSLRQVKYLVIDEADRMLDMGFIREVSSIIGAMPGKHNRQSMLFSATLDDNVHRLARSWLNKPVVCKIAPDQIATDQVQQLIYTVSASEKLPLLVNILKQPETDSTLIFVNRRDTAQWLFSQLKQRDFQCGLLTGAVNQQKRSTTLDSFRSGKLRCLVATDVAGRGLHVEGLSHVVNYDLPLHAQDYVHRIGRTGRAGKKGCSISLACEQGVFDLIAIEELLKQKLHCEVAPEYLL